jgi:hypothetical protein
MITDTFGQRFWIKAAGSGAADGWRRWSMFNLDVTGTAPDRPVLGLYLPPTAPAVLERPPVEDALLVRDEDANMVWGIERTVWLATGMLLPALRPPVKVRPRTTLLRPGLDVWLGVRRATGRGRSFQRPGLGRADRHAVLTSTGGAGPSPGPPARGTRKQPRSRPRRRSQEMRQTVGWHG